MGSVVRRSGAGSMCLIAVVSFPAFPAAAQDSVKSRVLCDPAEIRNRCPGENCACVEDVLAVTFDAVGDSVLSLDTLLPEAAIDTTVVLDVKSDGIQGWSYGISHDMSLLRLESVAFEGTDAARLFKNGFQLTSMDEISDCPVPQDWKCTRSTPGGGYVVACVLSQTERITLPPGRNSLSKAVYKLQDAIADQGLVGATIGITNTLRRLSSPPVAINITVVGKSRQSRIVIDGWIGPLEGVRSTAPFHRGDPNDDGRSNVLDSIFLLLHLFQSGPAPSCLESADFDDNGRLDGTDPILILHWVFLRGAAPPMPGPPSQACGDDPPGSTESLGCAEYGSC